MESSIDLLQFNFDQLKFKIIMSMYECEKMLEFWII